MDEFRKASEPDMPSRQTMSDVVFETLYRQILSLDLPPNARVSEAEVASNFGVSRQPVRDAFYRLSRLGLLDIRPQRATVVSKISVQAVAQAMVIRRALEAEAVRMACERFGSEEIEILKDLLEQQRVAVEQNDPLGFHELDDDFHWEICRLAGLEFVWEVIWEQKVHMDRVRYASLSFAIEDAFSDHLAVLKAIEAKDAIKAEMAIREHLSRLRSQMSKILGENNDYFSGDWDFEL